MDINSTLEMTIPPLLPSSLLMSSASNQDKWKAFPSYHMLPNMTMPSATSDGFSLNNPSLFNDISPSHEPLSFTDPLDTAGHTKHQKASSAPSASLCAPSHGSAGGHSVGSGHGAGAHLTGGSGRSHKGGTNEEIAAMGSILDCMTDVMENQNLLYKAPVVDEVAVSHRLQFRPTIWATMLWRKRQKLSTTSLPIPLLLPHTNFLTKSFTEPGFTNQPYRLPLVRD